MSGLATELERYLELRRQMGFKLRRAEKLLRQFVAYCEAQGIEVVTAAVALRWATLPERPSPAWVSMRLQVVRGFARHLSLVDERHQMVPTWLVPARPTRATPYLYSEQEVAALMAAARWLGSPMRQASYAAIVGLLWATGMRVGEAFTLDTADVDLSGGVLTVRDAKFGKTRELAVHQTTTDALDAYLQRRRRLCPQPTSPAFFLSAAGTRVRYDNFHLGFQQLVHRAGLKARSAHCRPRPHDLRHSFAVRTLIDWYRDGADVEAMLPRLSTYLGHIHPAHTYWYLSAAPELLGQAAERLAKTTKAHR
jgi:site-specific recombinase XerD